MALHIYNSLTRSKDKVKPIMDKHISIYTCGPTVYSFPHIGNYRTYIMWDLVVRSLRFLDYRVKHVMNITDVGHLTDDELLASDEGQDKMEKAAAREQKTVWDIAKFYEEDFLAGLKSLRIAEPDTLCRATDHVEEMITMIAELIGKGHAYATPSGVYYEISTFSEYGQLSGNTTEQLEEGASGRVEKIADKRSPNDFALWVIGKDQSMMWDSPWGKGFPGWHIECSAMARKYLGDWFDIHGGGLDNKFPHHECEIAQSVPLAKKKHPFAHTWMHTGLITVDGEKMAKSKGTAYTLHDLQKKGVSFRALRMLYMSAHYRSNMDFSWNAFDQARSSLHTFDRIQERLASVEVEGEIRPDFNGILNGLIFDVMEALEDDFNTPEVFATIFTFIKEMNSLLDEENVCALEAKAVLGVFATIDSSLGVLLSWEEKSSAQEAPKEVTTLFEARNAAKEAKDWPEADRLRDELKEAGYMVEDTKNGPVLRPVT